MLQKFEITTFRGLKDLAIEHPSRVNVITGGNNLGKTSFLEALYLLLANGEQMKLLPKVFRNYQTNDVEHFAHYWLWLLPGRDRNAITRVRGLDVENTKCEVSLQKLEGVNDRLSFRASRSFHSPEGVEVTGAYNGLIGPNQLGYSSIEISPNNPAVHQFYVNRMGTKDVRELPSCISVNTEVRKNPGAEAERFSEVVVTNEEDRLVELLRCVAPKLKKLRYAKVTAEALIYADIGLGMMIPTSQMGQAFERLLTLYIEMITVRPRVLIIDEIENGLHSSVYTDVWKGIAELAEKLNIQIFATTHSKECLNAANAAAGTQDGHGFSHHRLRTENDVVVLRSSQSVLGMEI